MAGRMLSRRPSVSDTVYILLAAALAAAVAWQLITGVTGATWWWGPRLTRREQPVRYWLMVALQCGILAAFLVTGKSWHMRR